MEKVNNNSNNTNILTNYKKIDKNKKVDPKEKLILKGIELKKSNTKKQNNDVKVNISDAVKDFVRIKKVIKELPEVDNNNKINELKAKIKNKEYKVNYDKLAEKILKEEF